MPDLLPFTRPAPVSAAFEPFSRGASPSVPLASAVAAIVAIAAERARRDGQLAVLREAVARALEVEERGGGPRGAA
jgi:hypothetical protein